MATAPTVKINALAWRANLQEFPLEIEGACIRIETYLSKSPDKIKATREPDEWAQFMGKGLEDFFDLLRKLVRANLVVISCGVTELAIGYNHGITISLPGHTSSGIADPEVIERAKEKNREKQARFQERKRAKKAAALAASLHPDNPAPPEPRASLLAGGDGEAGSSVQARA